MALVSSVCISLYLRSIFVFDFILDEKRRTGWLAIFIRMVEKSLLLFGISGRAGDTNPRRFKQSILFIVKRRWPQVQRASHPETKVACFAIGVVRFVITDVADPGSSFNVVAATHIKPFNIIRDQYSKFERLLCPWLQAKASRWQGKASSLSDNQG